MRLFTVVLAASLACCSPEVPEQGASGTLAPIERPPPTACRRAESELGGNNLAETVLAALEASRENDRRCGTPSTDRRICRALLAVAIIDPAHDLASPSRLARSSDLMAWVTLDGAGAARDPELARALTAVGHAAEQLGRLADEAELAEVIIERGRPAVTGPLDRAWRDCQAELR